VKKQRIGNDKVTDISVDNDGNCVSVGVRHACRWQLQNCRFKRRKILAKKIANLRQELCCSTMFQNGKICVLGATNGDVYICKDRTIVRKIVAHNGAVRVIFAESDSSFLTAGADGYVKRFSLEHDKNSESVVMEIPKADIVCLSRDHDDSIILTTSRAEIYRCATEDSKQNLLLSCHYGNEICGVVALSSSECTSCGEDGTVRVWNLEHHKQICVRDVGGRATSISYDPTEKRLVVCVQRHHKDKTIELVELDASTLKELRRLETKARKPCRVIKFSPDGRWIALGSNDHKIYLHDSTELKCRHVLGKHNAVVQNLDWTSDSRYLHSTCAGHELLFWDAERGQHMPGGAIALRDAEWASWTCTLGWPVSGLNALMDISCVSASEDLVVYGDLTGNLQLARFPSPETPWRHETYYGHGSRVTSLAWSSDRSTIVSIGGGEDRSLFIWRLVEVNNLDVDEKKSMPTEEIESISKEEETSPSKEEEKNEVLSSLSSSKEEEETLPLKNEEEDEQETVSSTKEESSSNEEEDKVPASKEGEIPTRSTQSTTKNQQQEPTPDDDSEHEEEEDFSQGVHEPTLAVPKYSAPELDLEWIYGIRSFDRFDNVKYVSSRSCEDVVCHSGKICVVYNKIKKNQRFYFGHTRDVSCITTHPVLPIVASGEEGGEKEGGAIHIWNTTTMSTLAVLEGVHMGTILSLRFDPHGDRVLSVGQEIVAFYEWSNQARPSRCSGRTDLDQKSRVKPECIMSTQGETILHCSELQDEGNIIRCVFVTSRFVRRVRCDGTNLRWSRMSSAKKVQFTCCVNDDEENTLIGTSCGKLGLLSSSNTLELLVDAHKSCVNTLLKLSNTRVLSGGEDGTIKMWNTPFTKPTLLQSFDLSFYTNFAAVRSLDQNDEDENIILASTIDSSVLELDMTKTTSMISLLLSGISSALTTALATTSKSTRVVVGSDDRTVTVWDMNTHTPEISRTVSNRVCDIDVSANDEWVAVSVHSDNASNLGIHILGLKKLEDITHISNIEKDSCWFAVLRYSTDNKMLAAGTNQGIIRVYDTTNKYAVLHTLKQHIPSCLVSLDWTHDSTFLQTYDTNKNVMFWVRIYLFEYSNFFFLFFFTVTSTCDLLQLQRIVL
jgi:WD40 repeat protein